MQAEWVVSARRAVGELTRSLCSALLCYPAAVRAGWRLTFLLLTRRTRERPRREGAAAAAAAGPAAAAAAAAADAADAARASRSDVRTGMDAI